MNPATKPTAVDQSGAHLRVVADRLSPETPGIHLSGVSKTYRSRDGDVPSLRPLDFHIKAGEFFVVVGLVVFGSLLIMANLDANMMPSMDQLMKMQR